MDIRRLYELVKAKAREQAIKERALEKASSPKRKKDRKNEERSSKLLKRDSRQENRVVKKSKKGNGSDRTSRKEVLQGRNGPMEFQKVGALTAAESITCLTAIRQNLLTVKKHSSTTSKQLRQRKEAGKEGQNL
ncbi:hypothetical protein P3T76_005046 [Phytophthora citrophthora]|uniref:Uncharacterized protein n=1 Tax=Phytophthora citrophthora TaxID=4793 RepID=A0AAD9GS95_9STRA|nr:hypothetical protein P3T76_005046 [Phytophthora citrophthora]